MTVNSRGTDHRLRSGHQVVTDVDSSYAISAITVPSDEIADADFYVVNGEISQPPTPARISQNADGSESDDGFYTFDLVIDYMSFGMITNWNTRAGLTSVRSAPVTVMTYHGETNAAVFLQCIMHKPRFPGPDALYARDGYAKVRWRCTNGVIVT